MTDYSLTVDEQHDLRELVLDVLRAESPLPISTNEIADRLGLNRFQQSAYLWRTLDRFARRGDVERIKLDGFYCRFWRLTPETAS